MVSVIVAIHSAQGYLQPFLGVVESQVGHIIIIFHQLAPDKVTLLVGYPIQCLRREAKIGEFVVLLVVLIITIAVIVAESPVYHKRRAELPRECELQNVGVVIVCFVVVVKPVTRFILILSRRVIPAPILRILHLFFGDTFPRDACVLHPFQVTQPDQLPVGIVRYGSIEVGVIHVAVAHIAITQHTREAGIERESVL